MKKILITRKLIKSSEEYASSIFDVKLNKEDKILTKDELINQSSGCDGILSFLTEKFDADVISKLSDEVKNKFLKFPTFWDQISDPGIFEILNQKNVTVTICIRDMTHLGVAHIFLDHTGSIRYALEMFSAIFRKTVCCTNF